MQPNSGTHAGVESDDEITIAIMGATGSGKSSFINTVSGSDLKVGNGLRSCTSAVEHSRTFQLFDRNVTLIDTPGFDDTTKSDTDILKMIAVYLSTTYENGYKLSGVIYIHRISDFRMTGVSRRNFTMFRKLCGDSVLKNVVIVTNMWGEVTPERGEARERELATDDVLFKRVLEKGARMVRHDNTRESAQAILRSLVNKTPRALRIQRELVDEHKDISQTAAGAELSRELDELAAKQREELAQVNADMDEALQAKDAESREELEKVRAELEAKVKRIEDDRERLSLEYAQEKKRADEKIMMAVKAEEEARAQMQAHVDQLGAGPRNNAYVSTVERDRMRNEVFYFPQSQPHFDLFALLGRLLGSLFRS